MSFHTLYLIALLSFAPGIFWLGYIYKKDRLEPEPQRLVLVLFFLGMLAVVPALIMGMILAFFLPQNTIFTVYRSILAAPLIEETCKFLVVYLAIFRNKEFDEPMDGIVYAAAAALGFASLENVTYLWSAYENPEIFNMETTDGKPHDAVWQLGILRGILSVPGHVIDSCMWGYALGIAKFIKSQAMARMVIIKGFVLGVALHSVFNSLVSYNLSIFILLGFQVALLYYLNKKVKIALLKSPHAAKLMRKD